MVIAVLFPVCHPMGSTSDEAWYWQGRGRGGLCVTSFLCNIIILLRCACHLVELVYGRQECFFSSIQLKFILSVDRAVKSLVTVEYQHAVIRSNVTLLSDGLEILTIHLMGHIIVFYQRL